MALALAADSLTIDSGPCWPTANMITVTSIGASTIFSHSSALNVDLSDITTPRVDAAR